MISKTKIVIASILFLIPSSIFAADWVKVAANESGDVFYYDKESLKFAGREVFFLRLTDNVEPLPTGALSSVVYNKFHCIDQTLTNLASYYYSLPMGNGEEIHSFNRKKTVKIDLNTDSVASYLFLILCIDALRNNKKIEDE